jgi:hypothetical protein
VRWISRSLEVSLVARVTRGRRAVVVIVRVALRACYCSMLAGQRIMRIKGVIEFRVRPVRGRVADGAIARQAHLHVRRIIAVVEVRRVA